MTNQNLGFFKRIGMKVTSYFSGNKEFVNSNSISKENKSEIKNELEKDFDKYLEVEDALFCLEMMEVGYKANKNQIRNLAEIVRVKIFSKELSYEELLKYSDSFKKETSFLFPYLFDYARKNNELDEKWSSLVNRDSIDMVVENFMKFMLDFKIFYKGGLNALDKFENYKQEDLTIYFEQFHTYTKLFKQLYDSGVMEGDAFMSFSKHLEHTIKEIKTMTSKEQFMNRSFEKIQIEMLENVRLEMRDYVIKKSNPNAKAEILKKIKKISSDSLDKNIKELVVHRNYSVSQLEEENKNQIKLIEQITDKLNIEEVHEFVNSRLPVILEKYLSIDKEYRQNLKNVEGYNAQELMTQSLDNIIKLLNEKLENKNSDLISELSIENRKLKVR